MKLHNTTDFPENWIREIIKFVKPNDLPTPKCTVRITNSRKGHTGKFYSHNYIIARIKRVGFPYYVDYKPEIRRPYRKITLHWDEYKNGKWEPWHCTLQYQSIRDSEKVTSSGGYINHFVMSREEELIHVLAHEFRHFWQKNHPGKRGRVWGARGQYSDRDADSYAIKKVRAWRRLHNQPPTINWYLIEGGCF